MAIFSQISKSIEFYSKVVWIILTRLKHSYSTSVNVRSPCVFIFIPDVSIFKFIERICWASNSHRITVFAYCCAITNSRGWCECACNKLPRSSIRNISIRVVKYKFVGCWYKVRPKLFVRSKVKLIGWV